MGCAAPKKYAARGVGDIPPPTMTREQLTIARYEDKKLIDQNAKDIDSLKSLVLRMSQADFEIVEGVMKIRRGVVLYDLTVVGRLDVKMDSSRAYPVDSLPLMMFDTLYTRHL